MANNNITGQNDENAQMMSLINIMAQQRLREQSLVHQAQMTGTPYTPPPQSSNPLQDMTVILGMVQQLNQTAQNAKAQTNDSGGVQPLQNTGNDAANALAGFAQRQPVSKTDLNDVMTRRDMGEDTPYIDAKIQSGKNKFEHLKSIFDAIGGLLGFGGAP